MKMQYRWLGFYARDYDKMLDFLRDTLGLKLHTQNSDSTLFVTDNGFEIEIFDAARQPDSETLLQEKRRILLGFNVEDINAAVADLKDRGVTFEMEIQTRAWGRFIYFADPEGNQWQLFQFDQ